MASNQAEDDHVSRTSISKNNTSSLVDLSKQEIQRVPKEVLELQHLKYLYLEGNSISFLPENFFIKLSSLVWLDLRHNKLQILPESIGKHVKLATLLLEGNQLQALPPGIGLIKSLSGLSLAGNPLKDPPLAVVNQGLRAIKLYLLRILRHKDDDEDDHDDADLGSTGSQRESDAESQHQTKESFRSGRKSGIKQTIEEEKPTGRPFSSGQTSAPTGHILPQTAPPLNPAYCGSVLGDMPPCSYIIQAWKTGSYFTRQRRTDHKPAPAMAE